MKTTCLINNYNYQHFLAEAVDSALEQTLPFDEIVVVDDGSTDGSVALLRSRYGRRAKVKVIEKSNEGQLSCFNRGFQRTTGDLICFLDADDVYQRDYLAEVCETYDRFAWCDCLLATPSNIGIPAPTGKPTLSDRDLGYSAVIAFTRRRWVGAPTSCISMRRSLLQKILPIPYLEDWRVRADDCLVFGASAAGGRKYRLAKPLVQYRLHENNHHAGSGGDPYADYRRKLAVNRLFELFRRRLGFDTARLADFAHREFRTIESPTRRELREYSQCVLAARLPLTRKAACLGSIAMYFLGSRIRGLYRTSARRGADSAERTGQTKPTSLRRTA